MQKIAFTEKEYPSISICPNFPFKSYLEDFMFKNDSISLKEIEKLVKQNSYSKDEIFYYVSYPTFSNLGYECLTTKDSVDYRKPCVFPFIFDNICKYHWCIHVGPNQRAQAQSLRMYCSITIFCKS